MTRNKIATPNTAIIGISRRVLAALSHPLARRLEGALNFGVYQAASSARRIASDCKLVPGPLTGGDLVQWHEARVVRAVADLFVGEAPPSTAAALRGDLVHLISAARECEATRHLVVEIEAAAAGPLADGRPIFRR